MTHATAVTALHGTHRDPTVVLARAMERNLGITLDDHQWWSFNIDGWNVISAVVDITPDLAAKWLAERNNVTPSKENRNLSPVKTRDYLGKMRDGRWKVSPQNIVAFDNDGDMLDGQHRLKSIVQFGDGLSFRVEYGWPRESFSVLDSGAKRLASQVIGGVNRTTVAGAARIVAAVSGMARPGQVYDRVTARADPDLIVKWVEAWPELRKYAPAVNKVYRASRINACIHLAVLVQASRTQYAHKIDDWLYALETGSGLSGADPRLVLRNRWIKDYRKLSGASSAREEPYLITVKAWNMYVGGEYCTLLRIGSDERSKLQVVGFSRGDADLGSLL